MSSQGDGEREAHPTSVEVNKFLLIIYLATQITDNYSTSDVQGLLVSDKQSTKMLQSEELHKAKLSTPVPVSECSFGW